MELELKNFQEYIENDFEIINHSVVPNINLIRHVDTGGFGTVNEFFKKLFFFHSFIFEALP
jgi:hypothetical protein